MLNAIELASGEFTMHELTFVHCVSAFPFLVVVMYLLGSIELANYI